MRLWREYSLNPIAHQGGISSALAEWLREKLKSFPPTTISLETNLGGLDEAGTFSPDFDWAGMVAAEYPAQRLRVRYLPPGGPEEAKVPYFVRLEIEGHSVLRAEVHAGQGGRVVICEDPSA